MAVTALASSLSNGLTAVTGGYCAECVRGILSHSAGWRSLRTHETDDFDPKIINLNQIFKKNLLTEGLLPGVTLGGE